MAAGKGDRPVPKVPDDEKLKIALLELQNFLHLGTPTELRKCLRAFLKYWPKNLPVDSDEVVMPVTEVARAHVEEIKEFLRVKDDKDFARIAALVLRVCVDSWKRGVKVVIADEDDIVVDETGPKFIKRGEPIAEILYENGTIKVHYIE